MGAPPSVEALTQPTRKDLGRVLDHTAPFEARLKAVARLMSRNEPGVAYALCDSLPTEDGAPKGAIHHLLVRLDAAGLFRADLRSSDPEVRALAAEMTTCAYDTETVPALVALLHDPAPGVRSTAADSLAQLRAKQASTNLKSLLSSDPNPGVRAAAAQALGALQTDCSSLEQAKETEQNDFTRVLIVQALGRCQG